LEHLRRLLPGRGGDRRDVREALALDFLHHRQGHAGLPRHDAEDGVRRIPGQVHLVQLFPDAHARLGRVLRRALVEQRLLAPLRGIEPVAFDARAIIEHGIMPVHVYSGGCAVALRRTRALSGHGTRARSSAMRSPGQKICTLVLRVDLPASAASSATCPERSNSPLQPWHGQA
jgi:hypothetical protein